ncbi:MAG: histone H1 [Deltaproteobacteria bacterium]|nr:histone H1 [Deltaproteobacteria bacterium]
MIESLEEDNREFYHGNDEAGTRLRDKLKEIKRKAQEMRREKRPSQSNEAGNL